MKINRFWLRAMGISGILGGLILFAGDMLFYYDPISTDVKLNMGNATDERIMYSGLTAMLATWFYVFGTGQVYFAFKPASALIRNIVTLSFMAIMISYGVIHGAYVAIATTSKIAVQQQLDLEQTTALASDTNNLLRLIIYPVFAILSYLFIEQVWKKRTLYSRWMIFFFPLIPFLFQGLITKLLSGPALIIIGGGYFNLILVLFFTASSITLWNKKDFNL